MIYVRYDTQDPSGLKGWLGKIGALLHMAVSIFDPQFRLIETTGGVETEEQAEAWEKRRELPNLRYPAIRPLADKTSEVIGETLSDGITIAYIVLSGFYFEETANPHVKQFRSGLPVYDEIFIRDALSLISFGVQSCLKEVVVIDSSLKDRLEEYISSNLGNKLTLQSVSRALDTDINSLRICLQSEFHCNLPRLLQKKRIEAAKQFLTETDLPLSEIAKKVGLTEERLSRAFKKEASVTTEEYRVKNRKQIFEEKKI